MTFDLEKYDAGSTAVAPRQQQQQLVPVGSTDFVPEEIPYMPEVNIEKTPSKAWEEDVTGMVGDGRVSGVGLGVHGRWWRLRVERSFGQRMRLVWNVRAGGSGCGCLIRK